MGTSESKEKHQEFFVGLVALKHLGVEGIIKITIFLCIDYLHKAEKNKGLDT